MKNKYLLTLVLAFIIGIVCLFLLKFGVISLSDAPYELSATKLLDVHSVFTSTPTSISGGLLSPISNIEIVSLPHEQYYAAVSDYSNDSYAIKNKNAQIFYLSGDIWVPLQNAALNNITLHLFLPGSTDTGNYLYVSYDKNATIYSLNKDKAQIITDLKTIPPNIMDSLAPLLSNTSLISDFLENQKKQASISLPRLTPNRSTTFTDGVATLVVDRKSACESFSYCNDVIYKINGNKKSKISGVRSGVLGDSVEGIFFDKNHNAYIIKMIMGFRGGSYKLYVVDYSTLKVTQVSGLDDLTYPTFYLINNTLYITGGNILYKVAQNNY